MAISLDQRVVEGKQRLSGAWKQKQKERRPPLVREEGADERR